jgi:CRISPR-associated endoribonuclease Cas6
MATRTDTQSNLRRVELTLRPRSRFPVPVSDGYSVYGALLGALDDVDEVVSEHVHDSPLGSLHNGGLQGRFGNADRPHHQSVRPDEEYSLNLGVVDPADTAVFQALVRALVLEGETLSLSHGDLSVDRFESGNTTHRELLDRAAEVDDPTLELTFESPACIEEANEVTTMFPHRLPVFRSLLRKWNRIAPEDCELALAEEDLLGHVIEKPDLRTLDTHSVLVNRVEDDGETRPIFRQGFTGTCAYEFKQAPEAVENAVTALALFGEYSGVGSAVARGCGGLGVDLQ